MTEQIDTPEALDSLPVRSVVLNGDGDAWQRWPSVGWMLAGYDSVPEDARTVVQYGPLTVLFRPDTPTPTPADRPDCPKRQHLPVDCPSDDPITECRWAPPPAGDDQEALACVLHSAPPVRAREEPWCEVTDTLGGDYWRHKADAALAWFAARPSAPTIEQMTEVLVAHQRRGSHSCLCGDLPLGSSFARHQAEKIAALGIEATP